MVDKGLRSIFTRVLFLTVVSLSSAAALSGVCSYKFNTIDVPGAVFTQPTGIDDTGRVVGLYLDAGFKAHGFLLAGGTFTTIDAPSSIASQVNGINNLGQVVGTYTDSSFVQHGYEAVKESSEACGAPPS